MLSSSRGVPAPAWFVYDGKTDSTSNSPSFSAEKSPNAEFTKFPELPKELRLKIWETVLGSPGTIEVLYDQFNGKVINLSHPDNVNGKFVGLDHPLAILHVCCESRRVGLRFYDLAINHRDGPTLYLHKGDILYLGPTQVRGRLSSILWSFESHPDNKRIQNIAFCKQIWSVELSDNLDEIVANGTGDLIAFD